MKGINLSCTSDNSISVFSSNMDDILPSFSSSTPSFSTFTAGGRAIDRHNPIITDEKRRGLTPSSTPVRTPLPKTPQKPLSSPKKPTSPNKTIKSQSLLGRKNNKTPKKPPYLSSDNDIATEDVSFGGKRKSFSKSSDLIMKAMCAAAKPGTDYVSPPESSRYLLDDTSFLEVLSDFDPVLKLVPNYNEKHDDDNDDVKKNEVAKKLEAPMSEAPAKEQSFSASPDQVVVLRVSLHCRGCERKMKKHLSRMAGVTSFNIDFAAKKVTVIGDVTPLQVLASISKVKNARLWTPPLVSSYGPTQFPQETMTQGNQLNKGIPIC